MRCILVPACIVCLHWHGPVFTPPPTVWCSAVGMGAIRSQVTKLLWLSCVVYVCVRVSVGGVYVREVVGADKGSCSLSARRDVWGRGGGLLVWWACSTAPTSRSCSRASSIACSTPRCGTKEPRAAPTSHVTRHIRDQANMEMYRYIGCASTCVHVCVCARVRVRVRACVCGCEVACLETHARRVCACFEVACGHCLRACCRQCCP